jgi:hypothetical protein
VAFPLGGLLFFMIVMAFVANSRTKAITIMELARESAAEVAGVTDGFTGRGRSDVHDRWWIWYRIWDQIHSRSWLAAR